MKNFIAGVLTPVGGFMAIRLGARPVMALGCLIMAWEQKSFQLWHKQTNEALTFLGKDNIFFWMTKRLYELDSRLRLYLRLCQCRLLPHLLLTGLGVRPGGALHRLRARGELLPLTNLLFLTVDNSGWLHAGLLGQCRHGPELVPAWEQRLHRESGAKVGRS